MTFILRYSDRNGNLTQNLSVPKKLSSGVRKRDQKVSRIIISFITIKYCILSLCQILFGSV